MPTWLQVVMASFVPIGAIVIAYVNRGSSSAQALTDNLQEELDRTNIRIDKLETRERLRDDYIYLLRKHIDDGLPPPPPAWPEGLLRQP